MQTAYRRIDLSVHGASLVAAAGMVLLLPLKWIIPWAVSSLVHELCHMIAAQILAIEVRSVKIGVLGAKIETEPVEGIRELLCIAAGPLGGAMLLLLGGMFPRLAFCALVQTIWNLLPVYPLDGGRLLHRFANIIAKPWADGLCIGIEGIVIGGMLLGGIYCAACLGLGWLPFLLAGGLLLRVSQEKFLANRGKKGYNSATI